METMETESLDIRRPCLVTCQQTGRADTDHTFALLERLIDEHLQAQTGIQHAGAGQEGYGQLVERHINLIAVHLSAHQYLALTHALAALGTAERGS